jgi:hypothetical protein
MVKTRHSPPFFVFSLDFFSIPRGFRVTSSRIECSDSVSERIYKSILSHPYLSQRERRSYLNLDNSTYRNGIEELVREGRIVPVNVYTGKGRPVKLFQIRGRNPSIAHEYGVFKAEETLRSLELEVSRGRNADLEVNYGDYRIAVEIETGSNVNAGKYMRFREAYDGLIVVCVTKKCINKARRELFDFDWCYRVSSLYKIVWDLKMLVKCLEESDLTSDLSREENMVSSL